MTLICIVGQKRAGKDTIAEFIEQSATSTTSLAFADPVKEILAHAIDTSINVKNSSGVQLTRWHFDGVYFTSPKTGEMHLQPTIPEIKPLDRNEYDREQPIILSNRDVWNIFNNAIQIATHDYGLKSIDTTLRLEIENLVMSNKEPWSIRRFMQVFGTDIVVDKIDKMFWTSLLIDKYVRSDTDICIIKDVRQKHEIDTVRKLGGIILHVKRDGLNNDDKHISERTIDILTNDYVIENNGTLDDLKTEVNKFLFEIRD